MMAHQVLKLLNIQPYQQKQHEFLIRKLNETKVKWSVPTLLLT